MLPPAAGTAAVGGMCSPRRSPSADLRLTAHSSPLTSRPRRASASMRRWQTCLRSVLNITLTLCENFSTMTCVILAGQDLILSCHVLTQGSRMLTNDEIQKAVIVAPLNQLVDERYTIYWNVAAHGGRARAMSSTGVAAIAATCMLALGSILWLKQFVGEARAKLWERDEAACTAAASEAQLHSAPAVASEMPVQSALAAVGVSFPSGVKLQPEAASATATNAIEAASTNVSGGTSELLKQKLMVSSADAIAPSVASVVSSTLVASLGACKANDTSEQRQSVTSQSSGPLRQRNICASLLSSACEDDDAADDAATSCGSFELLAATK